jgi:hypothetical protein
MLKKIFAATKAVTLERGSRKYSLFLICLAALVVGLAVGGALPAAAASYSIFVGGVLGLYGVYCSGNVAAKWSPVAPTDVLTSQATQEEEPGPNG